MSTKYPGGFITKSPVAPTTSAASGIWTLDQQQQAQKAGTWPAPPNYIEEVFSTYLYTGTGAAQTITNGINLAGKGGMTWVKGRSANVVNLIFDTVRGYTNTNAPYLITNNTDSEFASANTMNATSSGFDIGVAGGSALNANGTTYCSWTFQEQAKFFDIVTYTGDGASSRAVSHSLGSVPGCIIVKKTSAVGTNWAVYHRSLGNNSLIYLNATDSVFTPNTEWANTTPTSTVFYVSGTGGDSNASGATYVAYLFAHDAGGFGLTGTDNVISCGSFTTNSPDGWASINLGYEPQWILYKNTTNAEDWFITDVLRGQTTGSTTSAVSNANTNTVWLKPNSSAAEVTNFQIYGAKTQTSGFTLVGGGGTTASSTYIYIAIRRGPMKTPTVGTSVFKPTAYAGAEPTPQFFATGFTVDMNWYKYRDLDIGTSAWSRLTGGNLGLVTSSTGAQVNIASDSGSQILAAQFQRNDGFSVGTGAANAGGTQSINYAFQRAPGFFDVVAYTGTGSARTVTHNLGVAPELMIVRTRSASGSWIVYSATLGATKAVYLNYTDAQTTSSALWNNTAPTSSVFTVGTDPDTNNNGGTLVSYLFATLAGVSKVGSYTGTGALQTVNCGFTTGARFVLIKRSDGTGDWWAYDSARGITSGNDPYFFINSTAVEATGTNYVDTDTTGFKVTAAAPAGLNANGGNYIFLAIA
jgi:hypothetical protein